MKIRNRLLILMGCAGLGLMLNASVTNAQVVAEELPDSEFNHLECYKIADVPGARYYFDVKANDSDFLPPNTIDKGCSLRRRADSLCIDVRTSNMSPKAIGDSPDPLCGDGITVCATDNDCPTGTGFCSRNPRTSPLGDIPNAWDYICYKVRCDRQSQPGPGVTVTVEDRFGERNVKIRRAWKICVPILNKSN